MCRRVKIFNARFALQASTASGRIVISQTSLDRCTWQLDYACRASASRHDCVFTLSARSGQPQCITERWLQSELPTFSGDNQTTALEPRAVGRCRLPADGLRLAAEIPFWWTDGLTHCPMWMRCIFVLKRCSTLFKMNGRLRTSPSKHAHKGQNRRRSGRKFPVSGRFGSSPNLRIIRFP